MGNSFSTLPLYSERVDCYVVFDYKWEEIFLKNKLKNYIIIQKENLKFVHTIDF